MSIIEKIVRPSQYEIRQGPNRVKPSVSSVNPKTIVAGVGTVKKYTLNGSASLSASWYQTRHPTEDTVGDKGRGLSFKPSGEFKVQETMGDLFAGNGNDI